MYAFKIDFRKNKCELQSMIFFEQVKNRFLGVSNMRIQNTVHSIKQFLSYAQKLFALESIFATIINELDIMNSYFKPL